MANDLGDSHASSLQQGGALPASSATLRNVGKIFAESGKTITVNVYPSNSTPSLTVNLYNSVGTQVQTVSGTGTLTLTYSPGSTGVYEIRVKNSSASNPAQNVFVKATYTAPKTASTSTYPMVVTPKAQTIDNIEIYDLSGNPAPVRNTSRISFRLEQPGFTSLSLFNINGQLVENLLQRNLPAGKHYIDWNADKASTGVYLLKLSSSAGTEVKKLVVDKK